MSFYKCCYCIVMYCIKDASARYSFTLEQRDNFKRKSVLGSKDAEVR